MLLLATDRVRCKAAATRLAGTRREPGPNPLENRVNSGPTGQADENFPHDRG